MVGEALESGWLSSTPVDDNVFRQFVHNQARVNETVAVGVGGCADAVEGAFLADAGSPVAYLNQAVLTRPVFDAADPALESIESFFAGGARPVTVLSVWPTPDLSMRGWSLVGHPAVVLRSPGEMPDVSQKGVDVVVAESAQDIAVAERVVIEGYPLPEAQGTSQGSLFPAAAVGSELVVRVAYLDGEPVGVGNVLVSHGLVNLCLAATLPVARRRGVWRALVAARVNQAPDLPSVAFTSDLSRPGFVRMGFLPVTRFTMWSFGP